MEVVMVFLNFLNLSWELCFALEAKDSEAMAEDGEHELCLVFKVEDVDGPFLVS